MSVLWRIASSCIMAFFVLAVSLAVSLVVSLVVSAAAAGLTDNPISASYTHYLDGDAWTASGYATGPPSPSPPHGSAKYTISANVPGDLLTDLQQANIIGDPLFETNFLNAVRFKPRALHRQQFVALSLSDTQNTQTHTHRERD